ncbi:MAG TPA: hypothetical protein PKE04_14280, partial [Clostridia bacterium]|nr:hypothetical protein [Clostridia bacterium]
MKRALTQAQRERISAHDYRIEGPLTHPYESIQMGNGDVGASVNIYTHEVKLTLGKSDVWDAKYDGRAEETALTHDDLLQMMREKQRDLEPGQDYLIHSKYYNFFFRGDENHGPYPKRAGAVRVYHPGLSNTKVSTRLSLLTGLLETRFGFPKGELVLKAFIEQGHNRLWLTVEGTGELPWVALIVEKEPDDVDRSIPFPAIGFGDSHTGILTQTIPGGFDVDPFTWSLAGGFPQREEGIDVHALELHAYRCRHYCAVREGKRAILCVGLATSREAGDTAQAAMALTAHRTEADYERAWQNHTEAWEEFWLRSNVSLSDKALESVWYRNHFGYGCALKEGILPPGIGGNVSVADSLPWRGDHHLNHNFQKWFVTAFPTNHPEWVELYADFIQARMDTFEYLAKLIFGLEGAYCELLYFPYTKKEHCNIHNYMGRALALTGWAAQPLWWHYEYMQDADWLRRRAYPYLRKAAQFYYNYMEKYMDESGDIYPSTRIEEPGWKKDFKGSRNVVSDLVMFRKCFEWAIAASEILGEDEAWREKWRSGLERVPPLGYGWENGEGYVEMDKDLYAQPDGQRADAVRTSRWAGGGWAVFPGEYLDGD